MKKKDIFNKIAKSDISKEKLILVTITSTDDKFEDENILGEKILFSSNDNIFSTLNSKDLLNEIINSLKFNDDSFKMKKAKNENIELKKGELEIFLDPIHDEPRLVIFGSGHVAQPLAKIAKIAGFTVNVVDDRKSLLNKSYFPTVDKLICSDYAKYLNKFKVRADDYLVIVTRGHQHDYEVLKGVINSPAKYIGMIGSKHKVKLTFDRLKKEKNMVEEKIERVDAPIGIHIGSETPAEIAVSIMGKIISVRREKNEA